MRQSDSSGFVSVREFQRELENPRAVSFPASGGAQEKSLRGRTGLQLWNQYSRGKLLLTAWDCRQFLQVGQRAEDRYDLVDGIMVSRVSKAEKYDHICLVIELYALIAML